jgi:hypothetical protein|tara:strand:- start:330 stop:536 length:207 start_codon:yes stop_codon:yes gene_type:complete
MTTWSGTSTTSTTWNIVSETAQGYLETEDNLFVLATESNQPIQQEDSTDISTGDWQDTTDPSTTWTIQ